MIKAIVFDCFGVLLADVMRARIASVRQVDPEAGQRLTDIVKASNRGLITREESAKQMAEIFGMDYQDLIAAGNEGEVKNEELIEYIKTLRPRYKLAMLSNIRSRERLDIRFDPGELDSLFDVVVASGDVGLIKPERQIYELTAEKLGVLPDECVMLDDVEEFCEGAIAAGMRAIHFQSTQQGVRELEALLVA